MEHLVVRDSAGFFQSRERLTCYSKNCDVKWGDTTVRQPYMGTEQWLSIKNDYLAKHPCTKIEEME